MSRSVRHSQLLLLLWSGVTAAAGTEIGGHTKIRLLGQSFPNDSVFRSLAGANTSAVEGDLRLNFSGDRDRWSFDAAYQLSAAYGEQVDWSRDFGTDTGAIPDRLPGDARRLFDLTDVIHDAGKSAVLQRIDRLSVAYSSEKAVVRFGRQALSWGNGLFYAPMDLVNPFDPSTIDAEFKSGDDMLYAQYLRDNGDDLQGAVVFRRNPVSGDVESDEATVTLKYHRITGDQEYDLLVAEHYGDTVLGIGGVRSVGGAIWRGDLVITDTTAATTVQLVTNLSYSWVWAGRNVSGAIEYYFNGFGQPAGRYDPLSLSANRDLLLRLERGELFALGRNYVAGSLLVEMSPLWTVTPILLANVGDPSALLQFVTQYSLGDNMTLLGSLNIPVGSPGTEFGGIEAGPPNTYLSTGASVFLQLGWYF